MLHLIRRLPLQLVDPRGRADRADFLAVAVAMFGLQTVTLLLFWQVEEEVGRVASLPVNLTFLYMAACATCRRLHDTGRSAWWIPAAMASWAACGFVLALGVAVIVGPTRMQPGAPMFWIVFLLMLAPALVAALWLHLTEGEPTANRFGPVPDGVDVSTQHQAPDGLDRAASPRTLDFARS